jgi:undecaprenyl-diphosphatase
MNATTIPRQLRLPMGVVAVCAAFVVVVLGTYYAGRSTAGELDQLITVSVEGVLPHATFGILLVDSLGEPTIAPLAVLVLAAGCAALGRRRLAVLALASPAATGLTTTTLKVVFGRTIHGPNLSYPSGHTAVVTTLALVVGLLVVELTRLGTVPSLLAVAGLVDAAGTTVALAQVTAAAHYPTDTLGGFCTALAVVPAVAWLVDHAARLKRGLVRSLLRR